MIDWPYFFISIFVFALFIFLMAVGVIFAGKKLTGSCGGLGKLMGKDCEFCDKKDQCKNEK